MADKKLARVSRATKSREPSQSKRDPSKEVTAEAPKTKSRKPEPRKEPVIVSSQQAKGKVASRSLSRKVSVTEIASPKNSLAVGRGTDRGRAGTDRAKGATSNKQIPVRTVTKREADLDDKRASHESRSLARGAKVVRERMRTRTISPRDDAPAPPVKEPKVTRQESENDDYEDETFEDYESDFEESPATSEEEEEELRKPEAEIDKEEPREMVSLPAAAAKPISALARTQNNQVTRKQPAITRRESRSDLSVAPSSEQDSWEIKAIAPVVGEQATVKRTTTVVVPQPPPQKRQKEAEQSAEAASGYEAVEDRPHFEQVSTTGSQIKMLKLLRLDVVNCEALDIPPNPVVAKHYSNSTETNEDGRKSSSTEKWTQHPPTQEAIGGGSSPSPEEIVSEKLAQTLQNASEKIAFSELLKEHVELENAVESVGLGAEIRNVASQGFKFAGKSDVLKQRPPKILYFAEPSRLVSVHEWQDNGDVLFVWTALMDTETPSYVLGSRGAVTCVCAAPSAPSLVFAGTNDGTVCLWDLQEPSSNHSTMTFGSQPLVVRSPTFTTALMKGVHAFAIRGLCSVAGDQLVSVDQEAEMTVWSVVWPSAGLCHLVRNVQRHLHSELGREGESAEVTDVAVVKERLLVAFDTALVAALSPLSQAGKVKKYASVRGKVLGDTRLAASPQGKNSPYFLVLDGYRDVTLFHLEQSRALWQLPSHATNDLRPQSISWASAGLWLLLGSGTRLALWDVDVSGNENCRQVAACDTHKNLV
ncbi:cytoplasmic dynein 2 intermediate chain 1 [Neocloeon triangulifer]|uniref:cytoplasmic dynein 2 intermediate chain 1 n=1 Tax=Neocloeon triangulifer TaxID=2078957 RepID=UPI00286EEE0C|nr:cytoplasmic dynein 2 intermediate chain 1 [Neocloeon triangulifer]